MKFDYKNKELAKSVISYNESFKNLGDDFKKLAADLKTYHQSNIITRFFSGKVRAAKKNLDELFSPTAAVLTRDISAAGILEKAGFKVDINQVTAPRVEMGGQYARIPSQQPLNYSQGAVQQGQGPEMLPPGQYHQVPSQQQQYAVPNTYSSADLALKTPQSPVHQQFGSQFSDPQKLQQTPQPQTQPQPQITRVDITKLFDVVRNNDVEALKEMIKANKSYVNVARDTDGYSPLHFAPNKQIAEMLVQAGADVNAKAKDGSNPVDWAQNNPELKQYLDGEVQKRNLPQGAALPHAGGVYSSAQLARQEYAGVDGSRNSQGDIYVVPPTKPVTGTGPDAPSTGTRSQLSPQSEVLNTFGTPQGGIYGGTDALSARDAEANKKAYEAEVAQQRPASAPPVSMQIHKTPTNVSPQLAQQQYAGASSVQTQPLAPEKRQLPTTPATNVGSNKVSSDIAAKQAALFGGGAAAAVAARRASNTTKTQQR